MPHPNSGCIKDRVSHCWCNRWHAHLTDTARVLGTLDNVNLDQGHFIDGQHRAVMEVALLDTPIIDCDSGFECGCQSEGDSCEIAAQLFADGPVVLLHFFDDLVDLPPPQQILHPVEPTRSLLLTPACAEIRSGGKILYGMVEVDRCADPTRVNLELLDDARYPFPDPFRSVCQEDQHSRLLCAPKFQLRKQEIDQVILAGMSANLCTEAHMRELIEQGFEVIVVADATAAAVVPQYDGYEAAYINFRFIANGVWDTSTAVDSMRALSGTP